MEVPTPPAQGSLSFFFILFTYFWLCWVFVAAWALLSFRGSRDHSSVAECGLLTAMVSLVLEHRLLRACGPQASVAAGQGLSPCSSWAPEHRLSSRGARA